MSGKGKRGRPGKPQGMDYAHVLTRQAAIRAGREKAARDATVQEQADAHTQRAMWLMDRMERGADVSELNTKG